MSSHDILFRSFFDSPNLSLDAALENVLTILKENRLDPDSYTINPGHGSRRHKRRAGQKYSASEILEEVRRDDFDPSIAGPGFIIKPLKGATEQQISVSPPNPRFPFQSFGISVAGLQIQQFQQLMRTVCKHGNLALAGINQGTYLAWQRCDELDVYERNYGPNPGFSLSRLELTPPAPTLIKLDISKNPGRIGSQGNLPVFVAADMWLGPAFWQYAPSTKEEILREPWLEVDDTKHYLYLKAYPKPFDRPEATYT